MEEWQLPLLCRWQHTVGRGGLMGSSTWGYLMLLPPHLPRAAAGPQPLPVPTAALPLQFPSMKKTLEFKAHDGEIEDIALGPDNKVGVRWLPNSLALQESGPSPLCFVQQVVTAGRDFQCCVWQQDQLVTGLRWHENLPGIPDKAYRYQACR